VLKKPLEGFIAQIRGIDKHFPEKLFTFSQNSQGRDTAVTPSARNHERARKIHCASGQNPLSCATK
jgi:hypothetical protein